MSASQRFATFLTVSTSAALLAASGSAHAASISDSFLIGDDPAAGEYAVGELATTPTAGQNPAIPGFSGGWYMSADTTSANWTDPAYVTADGLTYSNASGAVASAGGAIYQGDLTGELPAPWNNGRAFRDLSDPITTGASGTVYVGLMLQLTANDVVHSSEGRPYRSFSLFSGGTGDGDRVLQLGSGAGDFGADGEGEENWGLRLLNNNGLRLNLGAIDDAANFFVLRFDLSDAADSDAVTIWRNPADLLDESGASAVGTLSGLNIEFDRIAVDRWGNVGGATVFDEFRMGDTWAAVTAVPEPASLALLGLGGLMALRRRSCR